MTLSGDPFRNVVGKIPEDFAIITRKHVKDIHRCGHPRKHFAEHVDGIRKHVGTPGNTLREPPPPETLREPSEMLLGTLWDTLRTHCGTSRNTLQGDVQGRDCTAHAVGSRSSTSIS